MRTKAAGALGADAGPRESRRAGARATRWGVPAMPQLAWACLGVLAAFLMWSRTGGLGHGLWNDEAFTAGKFVEHGPVAIFLGADVPAVHSLNSHRLFSLLAWAATAVLGRSELVYRLWAVVPGVLAVMAVVLWVVRRIGAWEGVVTALLLTTAPLHAELATQARGYGLGFLAAAMILIGSSRMADGDHGRLGSVLLASGGLIGVWTLPVFVLPFVAEAAAMLALPRWRRTTIGIVAAVGVASLAFYAPVLERIAQAAHQEFGPLVTWEAVLVGAHRDLLAASLALVAPHLEPWASQAVYAGLAALAAGSLWLRGDRMLLLLLVAPIVGTYASLAAFGAHAVPRYVSYLLLHALVLAAVGVVAAVRVLRRIRAVRPLALAALLLAAAIASVRFASAERERAAIPIEGYREALEVARRSSLPVVTNSSFGAGFDYYGRDLNVRFPGAAELEALFCDRSASFAYVHYPLYGKAVDLRCLYARSPRAVPIPQLAGGPVGAMTVFLVR